MSARDVRQIGAEEAVRSDEDGSRCIQAETARYTPPRQGRGGPMGMPGFEHPEYDPARVGSWPCLDAALGELEGAFYLLVALDAVPRIRAVHQRLDIPDLISRDTCRHYIEPVRMYGEHHNGHTGVTPGALYWWRNHVRGDLYRIGRLEYMLKPFRGQVQAFRQRASRGVLALAADATGFDGDGLVARSHTTVHPHTSNAARIPSRTALRHAWSPHRPPGASRSWLHRASARPNARPTGLDHWLTHPLRNTYTRAAFDGRRGS
jgi:hypothetical protein